MQIRRPVSKLEVEAKKRQQETALHDELLKTADELLLNLALRLNELEDKAASENDGT